METYTEDDVSDMTENLFDAVMKPIEGHNHNYGGCGMHYTKFDREAGQSEYREAMNGLLSDYADGYELSEEGEVLTRADDGLQGVIEAKFLPSTDQEKVIAKVQAAIRKYRHHNAPLSQRREAVRELADVLEWLRPEVKKVLKKPDENALFQIANEFGIRHHNQR